jgi:hypothetical protein
MAISTVYGHVSRALEFFHRDDLYFAVGRTTVWADESVPPAPDVNLQEIEEVIAFKKVMEKKIVVPDAEGSIFYMGDYYREVTEPNAETEKARWIYVSTTLIGNEVPLSSFRQVGLYSNLVKEGSVPSNQLVLLPADVDDTGLLEIVDNRRVTHRQDDQSEKLSLVIEF